MNSPANLLRIKRHRLNGVPGLVRRCPNRRTRAIVSVYHNGEAGIVSPLDCTARCETHGVSEACETRSEAERLQAGPAGWCEGCRKIDEVKECHG